MIVSLIQLLLSTLLPIAPTTNPVISITPTWVIDIGNCEPVGNANIGSEVLSHSEGPDHPALHTNPDENPYHPNHFDSQGNCKVPKTVVYCPTIDADYESDKTSYIGEKPTVDLPQAFNTCKFTNTETIEYHNWLKTKPLKIPPPPAVLVCKHFAC